MYKNIFSPGKIGPLYLKNKIIMAPLGSRLTSENGAVTKDMIDFYALRAKGGVGAVITEAMGIDYPLAVGKPNHVRFHDDAYIPGHAMLAERIHEYGAKAFAMLWHTGINRGMFCGQTPVGPSAILNKNTGIIPKELTKEEITGIIEKFGQAGRRAMLCGYDGVEVHGGHGYLISSFVASGTNKRNDEYGGSLENRLRFAVEIVESIRKYTRKDFPILYRINGDDFCEGGITQEEGIKLAKALEKAGVVAIDVSAGVYSTIDRMIEPIQYEEGWKIYLAEAVKKEVSIPVIGVGVLHTPEKIDKMLVEKRIDFAALGRELLAEPMWTQKVLKGDKHLLYCIGCNSCFERIGKNLPLRCAINPLAGRETHKETLIKPEDKKNIAVVGAGPAGIMAAIIGARRGHNVSLFEETNKIGGQLILAAAPPRKEKINDYVAYLAKELSNSSVKVNLNHPFTVETAKESNFDSIVVATGANCREIPVEGANSENIITSWKVLEGVCENYNDKNVIVIGAGSVGCETALYIKERGAAEVSIIELREKIGMDIDMITRTKINSELEEAEIKLYPSSTVKTYDAGTNSAIIAGAAEKTIPCDLIVIAIGAVQNNQLVDKLYNEGYVVYPIGDATNIGKIGDAVAQGFNVGASF